ncbi:hypothetical protein NSK_003469 [Nannochloropsis salina CCMP1776]|uniref:6-phosphogluconate dehydrogenase NADP-binding domain-containing protein n=1 Tax=Nannochloropsis salina CCMP1776 TaxID=1027361 RepID=A0A4D9D6G0_9STRA|nr:hypothetical protein NSK_003469 [Nannochloropsis salina CCMP1776]|eukprot:TFJ85045.1 hypothetical protein NSK_003469 [Nannochloropsis salina CCMP1776]
MIPASGIIISPATTRIGWVGVGIMGCSMVTHLLNAGYQCTIYNRTPSKCLPVQAKGAVVASSPHAVAAASDVVFVIVGFPSDVRNVVLGTEGILKGLKAGGVLVDCTTSTPSLAQEIYTTGQAQGVSTVDAPVSGGDVGARNAALSFMVGGDKQVVDSLHPLWTLMGQNMRYMGGPGKGQHTKMVNQILIANTMMGVCEGLMYAEKAGLDLTETINAVGAGAAGSFSINNLGPRMVARDFAPGFYVEHFLKDLGIALDEARRMDLAVPGMAAAYQMYVALKAQGGGRLGTQALLLALERLNGKEGEAGKGK